MLPVSAIGLVMVAAANLVEVAALVGDTARATMLESMKVVAAIEAPPRRQPRSANDDALRFARSCYDHLAGQVGVAVTDALAAMGHIVLTDEGGEVTSSGGRFLSAFGADLTPRTRRIFCKPCLDWSERRYHLKGLVGARILDRLLELGWLKHVSGSRALELTSSGRAGLSEVFQIEINNEGVRAGSALGWPFDRAR